VVEVVCFNALPEYVKDQVKMRKTSREPTSQPRLEPGASPIRTEMTAITPQRSLEAKYLEDKDS